MVVAHVAPVMAGLPVGACWDGVEWSTPLVPPTLAGLRSAEKERPRADGAPMEAKAAEEKADASVVVDRVNVVASAAGWPARPAAAGALVRAIALLVACRMVARTCCMVSAPRW